MASHQPQWLSLWLPLWLSLWLRVACYAGYEIGEHVILGLASRCARDCVHHISDHHGDAQSLSWVRTVSGTRAIPRNTYLLTS